MQGPSIYIFHHLRVHVVVAGEYIDDTQDYLNTGEPQALRHLL